MLLRRLDRIVLAEIISPFIGSALLFTGLFLAAGEFMRFAEYFQKGESLLLLGQLFVLTLPGIVALTFPMAMLLAALLGFGRLSSDSEIIAIVAAGVSFERIVVPVGVFGLLVSLIGVAFYDTVVPTANHGREQIIADVKEKGGMSVSASRSITYPIRKDDALTLVHIEGGIDFPTDGRAKLRQVSVVQLDKGRLLAAFSADRASWVVGTTDWSLDENVRAAVFTATGQPAQFTSSSLTTQKVSLGTPEQIDALRSKPEEQTTAQLRRRRDALRAGGDEAGARDAEVEIARRIAIPFASLVFALIGAPLGVRPQRTEKGVGFGLSVLITFCYWIALQFASILGRSGVLPPNIAVMLPNVIGIGVALYLIRRVLR